MPSFNRALALTLLVNLGGALLLPHQHPQPQQSREGAILSTQALPPLGFVLAADAEADEDSSVCNLCILQRLLGLGLGASTYALQAPGIVGELARTPYPSLFGIDSYFGNPRGPPLA